MATTHKTRVLVVDDSAVIRRILTNQLAADPNIEVVGAAPDPYVARDMILALKPDVLTLDIEMPRMDGLTFLRKLMDYHPMPVVILSSLTKQGGELAMQALAAGAVEVLCKPGAAFAAPAVISQLTSTVKAAASANVSRIAQQHRRCKALKLPTALYQTTNKVLAIGASTGGPNALSSVLCALPGNLPGTLITQHMPKQFTGPFAARLDRESQLTVKEARDGDSVLPGVVLIAPGDRHLLLRRSGARYYVAVKQGPRVSGHCPSVDVLFRSVARAAGRNAVGVILTGMGRDGAAGLLEMRNAGATTIAQDEGSCVVYGMPAAAVETGAADKGVALSAIPQRILRSFAN